MTVVDALQSAQFVVNDDGKRITVLRQRPNSSESSIEVG